MKELMNLNQLMDYLTNPLVYSKRTIYNFVCQGKIPVYKRGKPLLFDKKEIDKWIKTKLK